MFKRRRQHGIEDEPHLRPPTRRDGDAIDAEPALRGTRGGDPDATPPHNTARDDNEEQVTHSVYDEPAVFPPGVTDGGRPFIDVDWHCDRCGYNLRGHRVGQPCPECGHVRADGPPPPDRVNYSNFLRRRIAATTDARSWRAVAIAMLAGGPFAIVTAFVTNTFYGTWIIFLIAVVAPAVEEVAKVAITAWMVEVKPWLFRSAAQIRLAAVAGGLWFGVLENVYYVTVVLPAVGAPPEMYAFRWIVCTTLHVVTTFITSFGLVKVWSDATTQLRRPKFDDIWPWLLAAMIVHGVYNGGAIIFEVTRHLF